MIEKIQLIRNAIDNIFNDVLEKAYQYSINHPQNSDYLNKLIRDVRHDNEYYVNELHSLSRQDENENLEQDLNMLTKSLKKKSLVYLSELQKLQESAS